MYVPIILHAACFMFFFCKNNMLCYVHVVRLCPKYLPEVFENNHVNYEWYLDQNKVPLAMIQTMRKLKSGYINGTRVMLGNLGDFLNTSAITDLSFLGSQEDGYPDSEFLTIKSKIEINIYKLSQNRT